MADLGSLIIRLGVDTSGVISAQVEVNKLATVASAAGTKAASSMALFSRTTINNLNMVSQRIRTFGYLATAVLTAPIIAFGKSAINMAKDFEFSMSKIEGLAGIPGNTIGQWSTALKEMSVQTGVAPTKLAESLYYVASAGFKTDEALKITEASAKAAATGMGEAASVADMLVSALNAYKSSGLTAARAMDIFTAAVREGKIEPEAFATTLGSVLPIAAEAGVSLDQVTAAMAAMSLSGASAANAATYLRNVLQKLMDPSVEVEKKLNEMGTTSEALRQSLAEQGLMSTLLKLRELTAKYGETMFDLFPNIRALIAALNLTGQNLEYNEKVFKAVLESTGDFNKAFEVASKTMQFQWNQALAASKVALIELGEAIGKIILPFIQRLVKSLQNLTTWFTSLHASTQKLIVTITAIVAALGPLALLSSALIYTFTGLASIIGGLITNFIKLAGAIKVASTAMKALVATGYAKLISNIPKMTSLAALAVEGLAGAVGGLSGIIGTLGIAFMALPLLPVVAVLALLIQKHKEATRAAKEWAAIQKRVNESIDNEVIGLNQAFLVLKNTTTGTEERAEAIQMINDRYGDYLQNMLDEKSSLQDIAKAEGDVTNAMVARISAQSLQVEKAKLLGEQASAQHKYLGDYIKAYQEYIKVAGKTPLKGPEMSADFMNSMNEALDRMSKQIPIDIALRKATEEKLNLNPFATFKKQDMNAVNTAIDEFSNATMASMIEASDGVMEIEEAFNKVQAAVSNGGYAIKIFSEWYNKWIAPIAKKTGDIAYSFYNVREAFYAMVAEKQRIQPMVDALNLEIDALTAVAIKENVVAEEAAKMWKAIDNPVLQKIVKELEQQEARLLAAKSAFKKAGVSTEGLDRKLQALYETAQQDLGTTGLQEADKYIKILQGRIQAIILGLGDAGIKMTTLQDIMKKYADEKDYLKYMAENAHDFGLEFDYIKEQAKSAAGILSDLGKNNGLNTSFAKQVNTELKNLPANIYDAILAFKDLREQFKFLEEKDKVTLNFEINAEKLQALETTRDILLRVKAEAKNLEKSFIMVGSAIGTGFGVAIPVATILDGWIKQITGDIANAYDAASLENLESSLRLLREQADAYGSVDNKLAVLSKDIQRTEREMYNIAKTSGVASQAYKDQAYKLSELIAEYTALQSVTDYEYFKNLYSAFGRYEESMSMLEVQLGGVEAKLRAALSLPMDPKNIEYIQQLTTEWGKLKSELEKLDTVKDSLNSLSSIFQDIGDAIGGTTGEMIAWIGELISRVPELVDLFNKYSTAVQATTTATQAQTVASQMSSVAKEQESGVTGALTTIKGVEELTTRATTAATNADASAKAMDTAATLSNTTATGINTAAAGINTVAKGTEAVAGATAAGAEEPFPYNIIAIALGVAAVIAALMTSIPKMKKGGAVPPGYPNDTYPAYLTSGELVLTKDEHKEYLELMRKFSKKSTPKDTPAVYSPKEMEIEDLTKKGSLPTGGISDEFQLLLSTYENFLPEQTKKEKMVSKIYNYNNISEQISKIPKTKSISKETSLLSKHLNKFTRVSKESMSADKSLGYLSKISKGVSSKYNTNLTKTKTEDLLSRVSKNKALEYSTKMSKNKSMDVLSKISKNKALDYSSNMSKNKSSDILSRISKSKTLDYSTKSAKNKTSNLMTALSKNISQKYSKDKSFRLISDISKNKNLSTVENVQKTSDNQKTLANYLTKITSDKRTDDFLAKHLTSSAKSGTDLDSSVFLKSAFRDSKTNSQTLEKITRMKRTNDKSLNYLTRISRGTDKTEKTLQSTRYLTSIAKMAKGGTVPQGYPRDSFPAMLSSKETVLPDGFLSGLKPAETNIHITLDGETTGRNLALVIRRIQEMN